MKKIIFTLLVTLFSFTSNVIAQGDADFSGGNGTQENPWQIRTAVQLDNVRNNLSATEMKFFKLMNDIDLKDIAETNNWMPYKDGASSSAAYMDFDGNGFVIKNMHIEGKTANYQSFAGFIWGTIRNLGLVNVYINCPAVGGIGAFVGYVGSGTPSNNHYRTGSIENCYATGYILGGGGTVGGIAGSIGRPSNNGTTSFVKNCYFSGELHNVYAGSSSTVRTGGIAGLVLANTTAANNTISPIQNCYATGFYRTGKGRIGGIVGETEHTIENSVAFADLEEEGSTANSMGMIVGYCDNTGTTSKFGKVLNSWSYDGVKMRRGGEWVTPGYFNTPGTGTISPVDGSLKDLTYLSNAVNYYVELGFPMAGETAVWSQQLRSSIYPQLLWVASRSDAQDIDGLTNIPDITTGTNPQKEHQEPAVIANGNLIIFKDVTEALKVSVYDAKGALLKTFNQTVDGASIVLSDNNKLLLVKMTSQSGKVITRKLIK
ncbi:MAG: hypothetical protein VB046_04700 [Paludibacter sp.]|nr:hypothetical protein [Paludibacter sp.]